MDNPAWLRSVPLGCSSWLGPCSGLTRARNAYSAIFSPTRSSSERWSDAVLWTRTNPNGWRDYPSPIDTSKEGSGDANDMMDSDEVSPPIEAVKWPQTTPVLREIGERSYKLRLSVAYHLNEIRAADSSQEGGKLEIVTALEPSLLQTGAAPKTVESDLRNVRWTFDELERQVQNIQQ